MQKGPLVYCAVILAALLMIVSGIMVANREFFLANSDAIAIVSGILALGVVIVLILILIRTRKYRP